VNPGFAAPRLSARIAGGCQLRRLDQRPGIILKVEPQDGPTNGISPASRKVSWDFVEQFRPIDQTAHFARAASFARRAGRKRSDWLRRRLAEIKATSGPDSLAFISSSKCTNEESYLMQKLARAVIGTNNMDNCSVIARPRPRMGPVPHGGLRWRFGSIKDIENASLVIIVGSNTAEAHPVLGTRVITGAQLRGKSS